MVTEPDVMLLEVREVPETVLQFPPVLAQAVNLTVPPIALFNVYVQTMVPVAPALRVKLAGFDPVEAVAPPVVVTVGGLGIDVMTKPFVVDLFVTVMVKVNEHAGPAPVGEGTRVMRSDFHVQELERDVLVRHVLELENRAFELLNWSVRSWANAALLMLNVKS
jgi:hypothetical protein